MGQVIAFVKPQEYFKEKLTEAQNSLSVDLSSEQEYYLVNLLCDFIQMDTGPESKHASLSTPLALLLQKALESGPDERLKIFKRMGDTSLYLSGFFQDSFNRKAFDITYYIAMGSSAYLGAAHLMRDRSAEQFSDMYQNLSKNFKTLVDLIAQVSDSLPLRQDVNILATYDRWAKTHSERLRKILLKQGIIPEPSNMSKAI